MIDQIPRTAPRHAGAPALPGLVAAYAARAVAGDAKGAAQVRITQEGLMWLKPGAAPRRFSAVQRLAVDRVAFHWEARFHLLGLTLTVVDTYAAAEGSLELRVHGCPLQRQQGPELSSGEAMRYLAELPWAPQALAGNPDLRWRAVDDRRVEVSTRAGLEPVAVTIDFDEAGDIAGASAPDRPFRRARGGYTPTHWGGRFSEYRVLGGLRMPTRAEVAWQLTDGPFVYWRARVTSAIVLDEPYATKEA